MEATSTIRSLRNLIQLCLPVILSLRMSTSLGTTASF
jgi:hypothetical protein